MERDQISEHAQCRFRQRGIRSGLISFILENHDVVLNSGGGCRFVRVSRRALGTIGGSVDRQFLEKADRVVLVLNDEDGTIVTAMHDLGKMRRLRPAS